MLLFASLEGSLSVTSAQISQSMENVEYISTLFLSSSSIQQQLSHAPESDDRPKVQEKTPAFLLRAAITNGSKRDGSVTWTGTDRGKYLLLSRSVREIDNLSLRPLGDLVIAVDTESLVSSAVRFASAHPGQKFIFSTRKGTLLYAPDDISGSEASQLLQESRDDSWKLLTLHGHKYFAIKGTLPHYDYQYLSLAPYNEIAESLGNLLRASLSSQRPLVTLSYELELVDSFITIQKIRFEDQLEFRLQASPEALNGRIPPLTIQPLVENAIHYGMEEMTEVCHIDLTAEITDGILCIQVRNEGSQFEEDLLNKFRKKIRQPNGFGIGLLNIDQRIRLIFGEEYGLSLSNENGFAIAALRLPFRTQDADLMEEHTC